MRLKTNHWVLGFSLLATSGATACGSDTSTRGVDANDTEETDSEGHESSDLTDESLLGGAGPTGESTCEDLGEAVGWIEGERASWIAESTPERIAAVGEQTWNVALKMLGAIPTSETRDIAQSSTSLYTALSMAYPRYEEHDCGPPIVDVLEFPETGMDLHHSVGAGLRELAKRERPQTKDSDGVTLNFTNSIWNIQGGVLPEPSELQSIYGATPNAVNTYGEPVRELMNCLIEEQSEGLLVDFIPPGYPDRDTFTADVNVSYLAAPWEEKMTETSINFANSDVMTDVDGLVDYDAHPLMYEGETFTTVQVPLEGGELSVLMVVPDNSYQGTLDDFTAELTVADLAQARENATQRFVELGFPKVDIAPTTIDYLKPLGIDCDPIGGIRQIFHGAGIEMDADGLRAVAATVVFGDGDAGPELPEEEFYIDRPFLFFIHDEATGFALFHGRYMGPQ